jgi:nicotinate phosphoribosyltransferase
MAAAIYHRFRTIAMTRSIPFRSGDALFIVDVQNDFLPGGALPVSHGDEIIPVLNRYIGHFTHGHLPIFATRDWHPEDHCSFQEHGGPWPRHCVMNNAGAAFPINLQLPAGVVVVSKGSDRALEAYSGFSGTDLEEKLHAAGVKRLYIGGLATDYCVLHTVRDALQRGFAVFLLRDATRAVNLENEDGVKAEAEMFLLGAVPFDLELMDRWKPDASALLTDLYQLTMLRGYFAANMEDVATFEFFVRRLPSRWNFLVAAGLEQVLDFLEEFHFSPTDLEWLQRSGGFDPATVRRLAGLRFTGDVHAMPEGTIFFPDEPILRVTAPLPEAQVIETRLINLLHFQTLIASKAVRSALAAPGKNLVDFGLRRAHGAEAGLLAARACYLAGFSGSSDVLARRNFDIPWCGTMAHSFVEACPSEEEAFLRFARANPQQVVFLIDTYDTEAAAAKVVRLAPILSAEGITIKGVRLDSGDLAAHARRVRAILDEGGLGDVTIFASGNIDEHVLQKIIVTGAPIDGFGVGTMVTTSGNAPYLDCAYKMQAYAGIPRCKHSEGKATWPGEKQVYRHFNAAGMMECDTIALAVETHSGDSLLQCVMRQGRRTANPTPLPVLRQRLRQHVQLLPPPLRNVSESEPYRVHKSTALLELAARLGVIHAEGPGGPTGGERDAQHRLKTLRHIYADGAPWSEEEDLIRTDGRE